MAAAAARAHIHWLRDVLFNDPTYAHTRDGILRSVKVQRPPLPAPTHSGTPAKLVVKLTQADSLVAAREVLDREPQDYVAVLNMANGHFHGGGFLNGAMAQEEMLCHCTSLYPTLRQEFYPLQDDELIYSPDVMVVKKIVPGDPGTTHDRIMVLPLPQRYPLSVISCAAVQHPAIMTTQRVDRDNRTVVDHTYRNAQDRQLMVDKINWILNTAITKGVQRLVLGAFGCGNFQNPIREVAHLMKDILLPPQLYSSQRIGDDGGQGDRDHDHENATAAPSASASVSVSQPGIDWARYGLNEVVIAIHDTADHQPVWNGFMSVFGMGEGVHTTAPASGTDAVPTDHIQYTAFPAGYVGRDWS